jgi:hypothetical protein
MHFRSGTAQAEEPSRRHDALVERKWLRMSVLTVATSEYASEDIAERLIDREGARTLRTTLVG